MMRERVGHACVCGVCGNALGWEFESSSTLSTCVSIAEKKLKLACSLWLASEGQLSAFPASVFLNKTTRKTHRQVGSLLGRRSVCSLPFGCGEACFPLPFDLPTPSSWPVVHWPKLCTSLVRMRALRICFGFVYCVFTEEDGNQFKVKPQKQ